MSRKWRHSGACTEGCLPSQKDKQQDKMANRVTEIKKLVRNTFLDEEEKRVKSDKNCLRQCVFQTQYTHGTLSLSIIYCCKNYFLKVTIL